MTAAPQPPTRWWPWARAALLILYIAACTLIAAIYIGLASLRVPHEVKLLSSSVALPDQPLVLYARVDVDRAADLTLRVESPEHPPSSLSLPVSLQDSLRGDYPLILPPALSASPSMTWRVSLDAPHSWVHDLPLAFATPPPPSTSPDDTLRVAPATSSPLALSWDADGGKLIGFIPNALFVRVADPSSGLPIPGARVHFQKAYGPASPSANPDLPPTDAFGLTTALITAEGPSVWDIQASDASGARATTLKRELHTWPAAPLVRLPADTLNPGQPLEISIDSLRSGPLYVDLWLHGALVYRWPLIKGDDTLTASLDTSRLSPLTTPTLATLMVCWSPDGCGEDLALIPILWSGAAPSAPSAPSPTPASLGLLALLDDIAASHPNPHDATFAAAAARTLRASPAAQDPPTLRRLLSTARTLWADAAPIPSISLVFDSVPQTDAALQALRDDVKSQLNIPFALLLIGGALFLLTTLLRLSTRQRLAIAAEIAAADLDLDVDPNADPNADQQNDQAARSDRWAWRFEVLMILAILTSFIWGIFLGLQHL
jgi:hypothetical protein